MCISFVDLLTRRNIEQTPRETNDKTKTDINRAKEKQSRQRGAARKINMVYGGKGKFFWREGALLLFLLFILIIPEREKGWGCVRVSGGVTGISNITQCAYYPDPDSL